jgi:hypothetical protein
LEWSLGTIDKVSHNWNHDFVVTRTILRRKQRNRASGMLAPNSLMQTVYVYKSSTIK